MKKRTLAAILFAIAIMLVIPVTATTQSATPAADEPPVVDVMAKSLSLNNTIDLVFYVTVENGNAEDLRLMTWSSPQSDYAYGTQEKILEPRTVTSLNGSPCAMFYYTGLAAKQMADDIYVRAYIEQDGVKYFSGTDKYSILQYAYNKQNAASPDEDLVLLLDSMLDYGAQAQTYFGYNTARPANAQFYRVNVINGLLADQTDRGLYLTGNTVTLTAPTQDAAGADFYAWVDQNNTVLSNSATFTYTVGTANADITAVYGETVIPEPTTPTTPTTPTEPTDQMLPEQEVRVVGINVYAGQENLDVRSKLLVELLDPLNLDSFGVSECKGDWETKLEEHFGDRYARVGLDCNGKHNATNFATYIFYRKDKYVAIDTGTFWMSQTPDVPSKYGSTVDMNRTCTWVVLENIETGFRYVHMNCHLDHKDTSVNQIQCQMIGEQIKRFEAMGYPVFATGDYNMREYNDSYPTITEYVNDARYIAAETTSMLTHPESGTIDYCFVTKNTTEVYKFDVLDTQTEPIEISDHRGVYVHAKVKSLPRQEGYTLSTPNFATDAELTVSVSGTATCSISVDQARDAIGSVPRFYQIELFDKNGLLLSTEQISCGYHLPDQPEKLTHTLTLPTADEQYRVKITPIGLFGQHGEPLVQWVSCQWEAPTPSDPVAPDAPDVIDVKVVSGTVADTSANAHTLEVLGTVTITDESYAFTDNGNAKLSNFKTYYTTLADGFSAMATIRTGSDVAGTQSILANLHAGGFGLQIKEGKMTFSVHLNGAYVTASKAIQANTDYHVVGVYDPSVGVLLYINGELVSVVTIASGAQFGEPTVEGAKYLCIGADSNEAGTGESFYKGSMTRAAIYSTPISYENVIYLYQNQ